MSVSFRRICPETENSVEILVKIAIQDRDAIKGKKYDKG
jgi:hypothetical protein